MSSVNKVTVYTSDQEKIKNQMAANSEAWHTADDATKKQLEAANKELASQLGSGVTFDSTSGTWSGSADLTTPSVPNTTVNVNDYSSYLQDMYAAQKKAALSSIESAYQQNVAAIDRAGEGLEETYQNARNQAAGASELAKRNFNEYAAANGLNSGTGGQAELARNVTLQGDLNSINTQEAQNKADLALQRTNAETEYNNAIAQAEASGDYELAAALYEEKVRYDNSMISAIQQQYENDLTNYTTNYNVQQNTLEQQAAEKEALAEYGNAFLQQGVMPSTEMLAAMGITEYDAQQYIAAVKSAAAKKSTTGTTSAVSPLSALIGTDAWFQELYDTYGASADTVLANYYKDLGVSSGNVDDLRGYYSDWLKGNSTPSTGERSASYNSVLTGAKNLLKNGYSGTSVADYLQGRVDYGVITLAEAEEIAAQILGG